MKSCFRHLSILFLCLCLLSGSLLATFATEDSEAVQAEDLTCAKLFAYSNGFPGVQCLYDGVLDWGLKTGSDASLTLIADKGIGSLYIRFGIPYGKYSIIDTDTNTVKEWNQKYLHDFIDLVELFGYAPKSVRIAFGAKTATIYEMSAFSEGEVPDYVQRWEDPKDGETDLVLFSAHCDDEQLFFAGVLPYYAGQLNYQVQLVYMTHHIDSNGYVRVREALDGLWEAGVHTYPVWGDYYDYPVYNIGDAYRYFNAYGWPEEHLVGFVVEQLRRFKPTVALGHDFDGEYGHGQHMVWADVLAKAIELTNDPTQFPASAETYGTWDVPKTYFHLYKENPIVMNWDIPLDAFDGRTAWDISAHYAYPKHASQIEDLEVADWYFVDLETAAEITIYSPCNYGLYRTTVGEDVQKNDFFENTTTYAETNGTAGQKPVTEPEATEPVPEETTAPTEPVPTEPIAETQPEPEIAPEETESGAVIYPIWPALVIGAAVMIAGISLIFARKEKILEK